MAIARVVEINGSRNSNNHSSDIRALSSKGSRVCKLPRSVTSRAFGLSDSREHVGSGRVMVPQEAGKRYGVLTFRVTLGGFIKLVLS